MKLFNCYHPKVIRNPYTGLDVTVKCGKCPACKNARITDWVKRLDIESSCHRYTYFFTLTYNEQNVPQVIRLRSDSYPTPAYVNGETGELIDMHDINETFTKYDKEYIKNNKVLNVLDKRDIQNFIKRLRYYFDQCEKGAKLRYYFASEIGPTTFRPHGHCLLFFDSEKCASNISVLLSKSWSFGNIYDPHSVHGSAASYCAAYLNGTAQLPKCYLHPSLKPFALYSKSPAIGTMLPNFKEIRKIFEEKPITFRRFDSASNSFKDDRLPRSLTLRLFPRCQRFSSLLHDDRVKLYRFLDETNPSWSTREVAEYIQRKYLAGSSIPLENRCFLTRYFYEISHKYVVGFRMIGDKSPVQKEFKDYPFLPNVVIETPFNLFKVQRREFCFNSLLRFVRTIKRVAYQAAIFGITIEDYVKHIEEYYEKLDKFKIRQDYQFQDDYFKSHPVSDYIYFDYAFLKRVRTKDFDSLNDSDKFYISSFDIHKNSLHSLNYSYKLHHEYLNLRQLHDKISHDLVKQKKNNDYASSRKDRYGRIINSKNI